MRAKDTVLDFRFKLRFLHAIFLAENMCILMVSIVQLIAIIVLFL